MNKYIFSFFLIISSVNLFGQQENRLDASSKMLGSATISISEINYNSDNFYNPKDWVEIHNYGATIVDVSGWKLKDALPINSFTIPAGTSLQPGAFLVIAQDIDTFHIIFPSVSNVVGSFNFGIDNNLEVVKLYDAGGALIKSVAFVDSLPWPNGAAGIGCTIQIVDELGDANNPYNWINGCVGGSPGTGYSPCNYHPDITEINYHSELIFDTGDWIEIWNNTAVNLDLTGWKMRDGHNLNVFSIPSGTLIEPDGRLVLSDSLIAFSAHYPTITNVIGEYDFGFSAGGEAIRLYDGTGKLRYSIRYNDTIPWPLDPDGNGYTLELNVLGDNPNMAANWVAGCPHGSPGKKFVLPCDGTPINTIDIADFSIQPNPFNNQVAIVFNAIEKVKELAIYDITGRLITQLSIETFSNLNYAEWNGKDKNNLVVANGIYYVVATAKNGNHFSSKLIKQ